MATVEQLQEENALLRRWINAQLVSRVVQDGVVIEEEQ